MSDTAEFTVKLNDKFSGPASSMKKAVEGIQNIVKKFSKDTKTRTVTEDDLWKSIGMINPKKIKKDFPSPPRPSKKKGSDDILDPTSLAASSRQLNQRHQIERRLEKRIDDRKLENEVRREKGMKELPSLMAKSPSMIANTLRALGAGGVNTGILGRIIETSSALGPLAAAVYAVKTGFNAMQSAASAAFDVILFSVKSVSSAIFEMGKYLVENTAHALTFTQRMEMGLGALTKNMGHNGVDVFNAVRGEAERLGLDVESTTESFRKLLAAQFDMETAMNLTRATADLQAAGASANDIKYALLAISQIKMKGKLQAEEVTRQLANAGVSSELIYDEIGKDLEAQGRIAKGLNKQERTNKILGLQKEGQISADMAIPAIIRAIGRKTGSASPGEFASTKAIERIDGMTKQLKSGIFNAFIDIAQMIAEPVTNAFKVVHASLYGLIKSPLFEQLKTSLAGVFIAAADFIKQYWPSIQPIIQSVVVTLTKSFNTISTYIRENGDTIVAKFQMAAQVGFIFAKAMIDITFGVYSLTDSIISMAAKLKPYVDLISTLFNVMGTISKGIGATLGVITGPVLGPIAAAPFLGGGEALSGMGNWLSDAVDQSNAFGLKGQKFSDIKALSRGSSNAEVDAIMDRYLASDSRLSNTSEDRLDLFNPQRPQIASFDEFTQKLGLGKKEVNIGSINTTLNALDLQDQEQIAASIDPIIRRSINKTLEEAE